MQYILIVTIMDIIFYRYLSLDIFIMIWILYVYIIFGCFCITA